jgi:hypothetical protein
MGRDELRAEFGKLGEAGVRARVRTWAGDERRFALEWLKQLEDEASDRLQEAEGRKESAQALAATAASRAAIAAERQADAAEKANARATIALIIAIVSIMVNAFMAWWVASRAPPSPSVSYLVSHARQRHLGERPKDFVAPTGAKAEQSARAPLMPPDSHEVSRSPNL